MTNQPREFWIKITSFDKVEMGGFRYSDAEISIDPDCGKNYADFKNALHVIEAGPVLEKIKRLEAQVTTYIDLAAKYSKEASMLLQERDTLKAQVEEMQAQTPNALKFLRERVVGYQASRNVFRVIDEEIKKYDQSYEPQIGSKKRKQFVTDRNDLIQKLRLENEKLKQALDVAVKAHESISKNSCCEACQQAKLVSQQALTSINEIINKTKHGE